MNDPITPRKYGTNPLIETKLEAEKKVCKKNNYIRILEILNDFDKPMTAKEIAVEMKKRNYSKTDERNLSAPRITEMLKIGWVNCVGTKKCQYTNNEVGVFVALKKVEEVFEGGKNDY